MLVEMKTTLKKTTLLVTALSMLSGCSRTCGSATGLD